MELLTGLLVSTFCFSLLYLVVTLIGEYKVDPNAMRYIFLSIIFISLFIPILDFDMSLDNTYLQYIPSPKQINALDIRHQSINGHNITGQYSLISIITIIYYIISFILLLRIFLGLLRIYILYSKSTREKFDKYKLVTHSTITGSFSFFKYVFIPLELKSDKSLDFILPHELIHIKSYHSLDILFANLYCAFFWFNPLSWKLRNKIQLNHEYIADRGVLDLGFNKNEYQLAMLNQIEESNSIILSSYFNQSIKKRIIMMSKTKVPGFNKSLKLKIISAFIFVILLTGFLNGQIQKTDTKEYNEISNPEWTDMKYVSISKNDLLSFNNIITSLYKYYGLDINIRTVYYEVVSRPSDGDLTLYKKSNMKFEGHLLKEIQNSEKGHKFYFNKIVIIENGKTKDLQPMVVEIE